MLVGESVTGLKYKYEAKIVSLDAQLRAPISQERYVSWGVGYRFKV